jgi:hypothetical protein
MVEYCDFGRHASPALGSTCRFTGTGHIAEWKEASKIRPFALGAVRFVVFYLEGMLSWLVALLALIDPMP